jgi:hypothetical protein
MNLTSAESPTLSVAPTAIPTVYAPAPVAPVLPWWVAGALLGGLTGVSATIIALALLVVWLMPRPESKPAAIAAFQEPQPAKAPLPPEAAKIADDDAMPELPREPIKLARRMPSSAEEASSVQRPALAKEPEPMTPVVETRLAPKAPIKWAVESAAPAKRAETNLIVPIVLSRLALAVPRRRSPAAQARGHAVCA